MGSDTLRRTAGLAGLAGALLFFAGDMLFSGYFGSGASFASGMLATVQHASPERLFAGGLVGPLAACLCIVGFWHVYLNIRPEAAAFGRIMLVAFCLLMVAGSAIHTLWAAKGLALKYCSGQGPQCASLIATMKTYWSLANMQGEIPGYTGALLLAVLVVLGKTRYPRWTIVANPAVLIAAVSFAYLVPAPAGAILAGGGINLSIAVFFAVSTATTWKRVADRVHSGQALASARN